MHRFFMVFCFGFCFVLTGLLSSWIHVVAAANPLEDLPEISADEVRLILVRHAETFHNIDPGMSEDDPDYYAVTPRGKKQSQAAGELVRSILQEQPVHLIFTSELERAKETLKFMDLPETVPVQDERIFNTIPRGFFMESGKKMSFSDRIEIWNQNTDPTPLKGYSLGYATGKAIQRLRKEQDAMGKAILLVSHGDLIAGLIGSAEGYLPWDRWENCAVPVGSISVIDLKQGGPLYLHIKGFAPLEP